MKQKLLQLLIYCFTAQQWNTIICFNTDFYLTK